MHMYSLLTVNPHNATAGILNRTMQYLTNASCNTVLVYLHQHIELIQIIQ